MYLLTDHLTHMNDISIIKNGIQNSNSSSELLDTLFQDLWALNIGSKKIASKFKDLLDAKTLNSKWDIMDDNKVQLDTIKLLLKLQWVKLNDWININLFNINKPSRNDPLEY